LKTEITLDEWNKTLDELDPMANRPPCPRCGSTNLRSHGIKWDCASCGVTFKKILVGRSLPPDMSTRPKCPKCGTPQPRRNGPNRWLCYNPKCWHQWKVYERN
jgi:ribosomal protein L37AE/L43A